MIKISKEEQEAIKQIVDLGKKHGYGNMLAHLSAAWAIELMETFKMNEAQAKMSSWSIPVKMHLDLMNNGEWDETGEKYK